MTDFVFNPRRDAPEDSAEIVAPRDFVDRPDMFGRWGKPMRTAAGIDPADARFIAANLQHWVTNAVREEALMMRTNLATLLPSFTVTSPEFTVGRLSRLQHGEVPLQLDDLLVLARNFDSVRDILVSAFGDATRPAVAAKPPAEGGMGPVISTRRGRNGGASADSAQ